MNVDDCDNCTYLTASFHGLRAGGIGNQLFEIMTIYGIGQIVKRQPFTACSTSKDDDNAPKNLYRFLSVGVIMQVEYSRQVFRYFRN